MPFPSAHADQRSFAEAVAVAAGRLAGRGPLRVWQNLLASVGTYLSVLTGLFVLCLAFPELAYRLELRVPRELAPRLLAEAPQTTIGCAMLIAGLWLGWAVATAMAGRRMKRLEARIVNERLCFRCGHSLLGAPAGPAGEGTCPDCGARFRLGDYVEPSGCVKALKEVRDRTHRELPRAERRASPEPLTPSPGFPGYSPYRSLGLHGNSMSPAVRRIVGPMRCRRCSYPLAPGVPDGIDQGRCPECGTQFRVAGYLYA